MHYSESLGGCHDQFHANLAQDYSLVHFLISLLTSPGPHHGPNPLVVSCSDCTGIKGAMHTDTLNSRASYYTLFPYADDKISFSLFSHKRKSGRKYNVYKFINPGSYPGQIRFINALSVNGFRPTARLI